jgi:hypothetical protein
MMNIEITNEATAVAVLNRVQDDLIEAVETLDNRTTALHDKIVEIRPLGLLTVDEMAKAVDRERNYIDSVWSLSGATVKGKQTRVTVDETADAEAARAAYDMLAELSDNQRRAARAVTTARSNRNQAVVTAYASRVLGPSSIAQHVGVDRNHVLRIARAAGVKPMHRTGSKNQYSNATS